MNALYDTYKKGVPYLSQTELCKYADLDRATVSREIKRLEKLGFVNIRREGRRPYVSMSGLAHELFREPVEEVVERSLYQLIQESENMVDEYVGKKLMLPPLNEVRKRLEEIFGLPPLEEKLKEKLREPRQTKNFQ
ncbi:MAG: MarR family transcriptional regulator [Candidatus Bathyarchaeia archaeon]